MTDSIASAHYKATEVCISYRNWLAPTYRKQINSSKAAYNILLNNWNRNKMEAVEQFKIILLNQRNDCIGISEIATGGMTSCVIDPKIVFVTAVKTLARSIILAHNHPSCFVEPSEADKKITRQLEEGGKLLDIRILDHLIVTPYSYFSFADEGIISQLPYKI